DEKRPLTTEERTKVDEYLASARDARDKTAAASSTDDVRGELQKLIEARATLVNPSAIARPQGGLRSLGQQYVESAAMEFIKAGHAKGSSWATPPVELLAATLTEDPASGGALLVPQRQAGILMPGYQVPKVIDLFGQGTTDAASISYLIEKTATNAADAVAEGGVKPESALTFEAATELVRKIATWLPVSEEMLADVAQIRAYIDARLRLFVDLTLEKEVISGSGIAPHLLGILNRPGLATAVAKGATESNADAIFRQAMSIMYTAFVMPDAVVLNPANWAAIVISKTSQGVYYGPGMFAGLPGPSIWGLDVVPTTGITAGTGLVGAFKTGGQYWRRQGIVVQASNSHADFFIKNLVAIRAETRGALAVYRPGAFGTVTGLTSGLTAPAGELSGEGGNGGGLLTEGEGGGAGDRTGAGSKAAVKR
ncbi:MAG: phage major capsid protein, partial [Acidobacteria bacterium]